MLFQRRYERARNLQKEKLGGQKPALEEEDLESKLEKGDTLAMILSALITVVPVVLLFLAIVAAAGYFFLIR